VHLSALYHACIITKYLSELAYFTNGGKHKNFISKEATNEEPGRASYMRLFLLPCASLVKFPCEHAGAGIYSTVYAPRPRRRHSSQQAVHKRASTTRFGRDMIENTRHVKGRRRAGTPKTCLCPMPVHRLSPHQAGGVGGGWGGGWQGPDARKGGE
jgi:hypothetical protein